MATILLSAAGAAMGAGFGGTVLGLSGAVIGRAIGATLGRVIDQRLMGAGSESVEMGKVERFRLMGASEGAAVSKIWGRVRVAGQVIWATRFQETITTSGGGKGVSRPTTENHTYTVSLAIALCEGRIRRVGRIWADGNEISPSSLEMRVYVGDEVQLPDPKISAVEGADNAPAYRGIAYVVIEDLDLSAFGNRVPQFTFEVVRAANAPENTTIAELAATVPGVCMIPGTGEYALATVPVRYALGPGVSRTANVNMAGGKADFVYALDQLDQEMPDASGVSLVVSWFGSDLRCGSCVIQPKVEQNTSDSIEMPWRVSGLSRAAADLVPQTGGRSIYGGTPTDQSVIQAIQALKAKGKEVTYYPFILMDQMEGNALVDPWTGAVGQPELPWRGRITTSFAPGVAGSPDLTAAASAEVAAFFGTASAADFSHAGGVVSYAGPGEWRYRRFILHQAMLCAAAGGVDAFCIGSELRGLTQIRGLGHSFPAVAALVSLLTEVRAILGPSCKLTYAADWSEYFGYHADGNVYFHLDPLWANPDIDFIGIDNYMPLSDWREGESHADAAWGDIHDPAYLKTNIAGGEGFDWYYATPADEAAQIRSAITDGAHDEPWVYRYKDLKNWWVSQHHPRVDGVRQSAPTAWQPQSKPFRFTEFGCAAIDKGTNQPNRFLDPKSSESGLPKYSTGQRDDLLQMAYFTAMAEFWGDAVNNPNSLVYDAPMLDFGRSLAWAWDARPFPVFPVNQSLWDDGTNYEAGHWLNGRAANQPLEAVITEVCNGAGLSGVVASESWGVVRGYTVSDVSSARSVLQPLLQAGSVDAVEREGELHFSRRSGMAAQTLDPSTFVLSPDLDATLEASRLSDAEIQDHLRLIYIEAEGSFAARAVSASAPDAKSDVVAQSEMPLALTRAEAVGMAERWLIEARIARDAMRFALPPSKREIGAGAVVEINGKRFRVDRCEVSASQLLEAVRIEPAVYRDPQIDPEPTNWQPYQPAAPTYPVFLDLPRLGGTEVPHAPHIAVSAVPWPGQVAVWSSPSDAGFSLNCVLDSPAILGITETVLDWAAPARWDQGPALRIKLARGQLASADDFNVLAGRNALAVGDGSPDNWEVLQFADAVLVGPSTYEIRKRLRGQLGTDGTMPATWPIGSLVVLLDDALSQISLPLSARGLARNYRIGAASRSYDAAETVALTAAFQGNGLRPYSVCHLRATAALGQDIGLGWVRRTRIDGDSWQSTEVPLAEETERYRVRILQGSAILREAFVSQSSWTYTAAMQAADGASVTARAEVAQISAAFGPGPVRELALA